MPRTTRLGLAAAWAFVGLGSLADSADIHVPADHASIQDAILAASDGDTVHVAPGTYVERLRFRGKAVRVVATAGPTVTTVRGPAGAGAVVRFIDGEGRGAVFEGFTVSAPLHSDKAIRCVNSSPHILGCHLRDNGSRRNDVLGGALYSRSGSPRIEACEFRGNQAGLGGAMYLLLSEAEVLDCVFEDNGSVVNGGAISLSKCTVSIEGCRIEANRSPVGGGVYLLEDRSRITDCVVRGNSVDGIYVDWRERSPRITLSGCCIEDNAPYGVHSEGSGTTVVLLQNEFRDNERGARLIDGTYTVSGNRFLQNRDGGLIFAEAGGGITDNEFRENSSSLAGGMYLHMPRGELLEVARNRFVRNRCDSTGGAIRFGSIRREIVSFHDNLFVGNFSENGGGALANVDLTVSRCTFFGNESNGPGKALLLLGGTYSYTALVESIVWDALDRPLIAQTAPGLAIVRYSNIRGGVAAFEGGGQVNWHTTSIATDPLFVDSSRDDLRLRIDSPCVDSGKYGSDGLRFDGAGLSRVTDGDLDGLAFRDMGALEYQHLVLEVVGEPVANRFIGLQSTGTPGLPALLVHGLPGLETAVDPYGVLRINLRTAFGVRPLRSAPATTFMVLPPGLAGTTLVLQGLAVQLSNGAGQFSSPLFLEPTQ